MPLRRNSGEPENGQRIGDQIDAALIVAVLPVESSRIPDDSQVIWVAEGEVSKAYLCLAMSLMTTHVVNDLVGTQPIFVTYCDQTDCARVFLGKEPGIPPALKLGGYMNSEMALRLDEVMYSQSSKSIPLADREFERATWGEWKAAHPSTVVYVGDRENEFLIKQNQTSP